MGRQGKEEGSRRVGDAARICNTDTREIEDCSSFLLLLREREGGGGGGGGERDLPDRVTDLFIIH